MKTQLFSFLTFLVAITACSQAPTNTPESELLIESFQSWNGDSLPAYPSGKPKISIVKVTIPPQSELPKHYHLVINAGVLLSGELTVVDSEGHSLKMKAGDPIIELVNKVHYGKNEGNVPAEIIVFYAGTEDSEIVIKE